MSSKAEWSSVMIGERMDEVAAKLHRIIVRINMIGIEQVKLSPQLAYVRMFLAGALAVAGFAPLGWFPLAVLALAVLFHAWLGTTRPVHAAWLGFSFGMGLFCVGVGWIYVALHDYGYMHPLLALLATGLFAALIALYPAAAGYAQARLGGGVAVRLLWVMPAFWVLLEWLRGWLLTGFPWLSLGYSQVPDSPLAGYAPVFGVYGVSLAVALSAGALAWLWQARRERASKLAVMVLLVLWGGGALLRQVAWTAPQGEPVKAALLQGNIEQDLKFEESALVATLETYRRLAQQNDARLVIFPETAVPLLRENIPDSYQSSLRDHARKSGGDVVIGSFEKENGAYYNSVYTVGSSPSQHYRKNHLVPFGEFIPLRGVFGWLINEVLQIPMGDLARGGETQPPLEIAGQRVAMNICYEDAFGEEIIRTLPQATLLVNVTNDAWYGESHAAMQHNQLSQMRALETGRTVLRATNTGVTSVIGPDGHIQAMLPQHEEGVLLAEVQGYAGSTPYVWWGNMAVLVLCALLLGGAWRWRKQ